MEVLHVFILLLAILLFIAHRKVNFVRYCVKYIGFYIFLAISSVITIPYSLIRPCRIQNIWFPCFLIKRLRWWFGLEFMGLQGREYLETPGPFVLVCNHQSSLDLFTFAHVWPIRCISVMKKEIMFGTGFFGLACWLTGSMAIDRLNPDSAKNTLKKIGDRLMNEQLIVLIFPEGTRNHEEGLLPFKKGAFNIAVNVQVPIVPMLISSYKPFMGRYFFNEGKFMVSCLPPIETKGLTYSDVPQLTDLVRNQMVTELDRINKIVEDEMSKKDL